MLVKTGLKGSANKKERHMIAQEFLSSYISPGTNEVTILLVLEVILRRPPPALHTAASVSPP